MKILQYIFLTLFVFITIGCAQNTETQNKTATSATTEKAEASTDHVTEKKDGNEELYASINGERILEDEIDYECFRAQLQQALAEAAVDTPCPSDETIITQVMELRAIDYLAEEKKVTATAEEVEQRVNVLKKDLQASTIFQEKVKEIGEEKFWEYEKKRYKTIINSEKIKADLVEQEKELHDYYDQQSLELTAKKNFDEMIVELVGQLEPTIFYH